SSCRGSGMPHEASKSEQIAIATKVRDDRDLFGLAGLVRHTGAAVGLPGLQVELQTAVVAVAGVDRPVTAGLALGQVVPHAGVAAVVVVTGTAAAAGVIVTGAAVVTRAVVAAGAAVVAAPARIVRAVVGGVAVGLVVGFGLWFWLLRADREDLVDRLGADLVLDHLLPDQLTVAVGAGEHLLALAFLTLRDDLFLADEHVLVVLGDGLEVDGLGLGDLLSVDPVESHGVAGGDRSRRPGLELVGAPDGDLGVLEGLLDGQRRGGDGLLLVGDREGDVLRGGQVELQAVATDALRAGHRELSALGTDVQIAQRLVDRSCR